MIFQSITIRSKLLLTTLVTVLVLAVLAIFYMDASKRMGIEQSLLEDRSAMQVEYATMNFNLNRMVMDGQTGLNAECISQARKTEDRVRKIISYETVASQSNVMLKAEQVIYALDLISGELRGTVGADSTRWVKLRMATAVLADLEVEFAGMVATLQDNTRRNNDLKLGLTLALGVFLMATYLIIFTISISNSFGKLSAYTRQLQSGKIPPPLDFSSEDEFGQLAQDLNNHAADLQKKIGHITSLSEEGPADIFKSAEEDELGKALVILADYLTRKELEEVTRNREDKKQNWISEGVAQLGEVLRSERENVIELSYLIIQKLVTYMRMEMGSLFITNDADPGNLILELAASYAYDRRKYKVQSLEWGVGLPGTCAQEKERIFLTEVPDEYFEVSSGTGYSKPNCILLVPLKIGQQVYGVVELATIRLLRPFEIEFVESLAESISSSLLAVRTSERTSELLKQSQAQADTLKSQEAVMLENMNQLEQAQEESSKKESEITGILNAINQSSPVAEMGLNGRFSSVNDRFLMLLESHRDQVVGKLHSEFAQVDPYSDEYKEFWSSLRDGKSSSNIEMYKLFSGKEVWLQQTFTPIINNEGKVHKVLNIAVDITENRTLQGRLETRELEITRSGLDMQTLHEAVNTSLIKCELDAEGIIMEVNDKYNEVTGYGRKEVLGRNYRLFLKDSEKDQFEKIWEEVIKEKVYEGVIRRSKPTGEEVWLV
ncbi:MAG: PAS domain S-box protein, partial [Bacteroidales bacterium]|nr:PAS domain S-box protein [Bacteroidales bacterium]